MTEPRIVPAEEALAYFNRVVKLKPGERTFISNPPHPRDLAYTAAVLGDALAAVRALAEPFLDQPDGYQHYAVQIGDEVHLAVLLEDLRAVLAGVQS
jgi:hypothetical protein